MNSRFLTVLALAPLLASPVVSVQAAQAVTIAVQASPIVIQAPGRDAEFEVHNRGDSEAAVRFDVQPDRGGRVDQLPRLYPPVATLPAGSSLTVRLRAATPPPEDGYRTYRVTAVPVRASEGTAGLGIVLPLSATVWHFGAAATARPQVNVSRTDRGCVTKIANDGTQQMTVTGYVTARGESVPLSHVVFPGRSYRLPEQPVCPRAVAVDRQLIDIGPQ